MLGLQCLAASGVLAIGWRARVKPQADVTSALLPDVEGWLTEAQAARLDRCARAVPAGGRIVEIGSFRGRSTIVLARAAPDGAEVVAIDPHLGSDRGPQEIAAQPELGEQDTQIFRANLERHGVLERVTPRADAVVARRRCPTRSTCSTSTARTASGRRARTSSAGARGCATAARCSSTTASRRSA